MLIISKLRWNVSAIYDESQKTFIIKHLLKAKKPAGLCTIFTVNNSTNVNGNQSILILLHQSDGRTWSIDEASTSTDNSRGFSCSDRRSTWKWIRLMNRFCCGAFTPKLHQVPPNTATTHVPSPPRTSTHIMVRTVVNRQLNSLLQPVTDRRFK